MFTLDPDYAPARLQRDLLSLFREAKGEIVQRTYLNDVVHLVTAFQERVSIIMNNRSYARIRAAEQRLKAS